MKYPAWTLLPLWMAVACKGGDTDMADTDTDDTDDTAQEEVAPVEMRFRVRGVEQNAFVDLAGARCEWTRRNGDPWPVPVSDVSDEDGLCFLTVDGDRDALTVRVTLDDFVDVIAAGFPVRAFDEERPENTTTGFLMFTEDQVDGFYGLANQDRDLRNGYVLGAATWRPTGEGALQPVGCVAIDASEADPGFPLYLGSTAQNIRDTTDPRFGVWLGFDVQPGNHTFVASIDGGPTIQSRVPVLPNTFTNIPLFFRADRNPTPADCE